MSMSPHYSRPMRHKGTDHVLTCLIAPSSSPFFTSRAICDEQSTVHPYTSTQHSITPYDNIGQVSARKHALPSSVQSRRQPPACTAPMSAARYQPRGGRAYMQKVSNQVVSADVPTNHRPQGSGAEGSGSVPGCTTQTRFGSGPTSAS